MPLHSMSPFDRDTVHDRETLLDPDPHLHADPEVEAWFARNLPDPAAKPRRKPLDWRAAAADFSAIVLLGTRYAVTTFVLALGLPLFAFFLVAGWDMSLLLSGLGGLAAHYEAAGPLERLGFSHDTRALFFAAAGVLALARLPRFVRDLADTLDRSAKP